MLNKYILIGEVIKPQGVQGEVKVKPYTDDLDRFYDLRQVLIQKDGAYTAVNVSCKRVHDGFCYIVLESAATREDAERYRGLMLYVDRANAIELGEDEEFVCDLIGCTAYDTKGNEIGTLKDVLQSGSTDVYVFDTPRGEMMMPALKAAIPHVDVKARKIILNEDKLQEVALFAD